MTSLGERHVGTLGALALGLLAPRRRHDRRLHPSRRQTHPTPVARRAAPTVLPPDRVAAGVSSAPVPGSGSAAHITAARRLNRAAGLLATSVLADSATEHYRGSFQNPAMFVPLISALLTLAVSAHGQGDRRGGIHAVRDTTYALAGLAGIAGTGFHIYNVAKRPGGFSWHNLFYGGPIGAPFALAIAGLLGVTAERVRDNTRQRTPTVVGLPAGRVMAAVSGIGMLGTAGEAGLLHFRGAYHDPAMFLPVTVPPVAAALLGNTALGPARVDRRLARWWLRLTAALGFIGTGFHIFGVARNMGGWRNWRRNLLNGPPIPAPPSFTALALAGLAALGLLQDRPDA